MASAIWTGTWLIEHCSSHPMNDREVCFTPERSLCARHYAVKKDCEVDTIIPLS